MSQNIMNLVEKSSLRADPLVFHIGDTVDVHTKILEGNKERIQVFSGTVIARSGGGARKCLPFAALWPVKASSASSRLTRRELPKWKSSDRVSFVAPSCTSFAIASARQFVSRSAAASIWSK